jgi:hypothetical protein
MEAWENTVTLRSTIMITTASFNASINITNVTLLLIHQKTSVFLIDSPVIGIQPWCAFGLRKELER